MKKTAISLLTLLFFSNLFCFEKVSTTDLLLSYLENDTELKKLTISLEKTMLSQESTKIENGFDITLETGKITLQTSNDGASVTVNPKVKVSFPQYNNLEVSVSTKLDSSKKEIIDDSSVKLSVKLISKAGIQREVSLLKADRSLTEAKRKLDNHALTAEKEFYTELKALLNSTSSLISKQLTLYDNTISFEKIKAQGYSSSSSSYKLAQMKVLENQHDIDSAIHTLNHDYIVFYKKCGYDIELTEKDNYFDFLPNDIPSVEPLNMDDFSDESYTSIESALWTNKINSLQRQTNSFFSLDADSGYTFKNSTTNSNTIDLGLNSTIGGLSLNLETNIPIASANSTPAFTLSATVNPNSFKKYKISQQQNSLEEQLELLSITTAIQELETKKVDMEQKLEDILWSKEMHQESFDMYQTLAKDMANWYQQGIITKSEYLSTENNFRSYAVKLAIDNIDMIVYNDDLYLMFVKENLNYEN